MDTLLRSKLVVPALPATFVARPRLTTRLDLATDGLVTVVTASAGWGKTTLLSSWVRDTRAPTSWLTVERDDDGDRFWAHVHEALSPAWLIADNQPPVPAPGLVPRGAYLCLLANALARRSEPVVVVLDGFHDLDDPSVPEELDFLLRHAEKRLRLIAATRTVPALALHRWRLSGELTEVTTDDLAFTHAETAQLMACHEIALPEADVDAVRERTEGWAAGLRLLALATRGHADHGRWVDHFSGDQPNVAEYLDREVLAVQPPSVREILLSTSVSERLHGGLVNALTHRTDGDRVLAGFAQRNFFTVAVPDEPGWYRYHPLLAELLRSQLRRQAPQRLAELHRRAASWHAAQGLAPEALRHALAAGDRDYVTTVLVDHWPCIVLCLGDHGVGTEVPPPPEGALREAPDLALAYAADRLSQDDAVGADHYLRLAAAHEHHIGSERRMRFGLILTAFQLAHARLRGDPTRVMSTARRLLALGTDTDGDADEPDQHLRARTTALASLGAAQLASGDLVSAERSLSAGLDAAELARLPCVRLSCGARLAVAQAGLGALGQAERAARAALRAPPCRGRCGELCGGYAYLALAVVHYEWDRLSDAGRYLDLAAACCRGAADPFVITGIAIVRTSVLQAQGDLHAAYNALRVAHRDPTTATTRYLCDGLTIAEANVRICAGDTAAARALLTPMLDGATAPPAALAVPLGRAYLRDGNPAAATAVLPGWADDEAAAGPLALRLEAGLLSALAAHRNGDAHRASHAMERVLVLARPEGFRRPFTRAGSPVRRLLADQLDAGTAHWAMVLDLLGAATTDPAGTARQVTLEEPLTDRELTVLRHLQGVRSNMEIASNLSLSVNTIKTHIRSIYRKLRVTGRREAITKARELDLV